MPQRKKVIQVNFVVVEAMNQYSVLELDLEVIGCFFNEHEMQFSFESKCNNHTFS